MSVYETIDQMLDAEPEGAVMPLAASFGLDLAGRLDQLMGPQREERVHMTAQAVVELMAYVQGSVIVNRGCDPMEADESIN